MDWTKIKTKHFLFSELSKPLKGDLADLLCLTAHLEQMPTERQMAQICRKKSINLLQNWFISRSNSLQIVLEKVLEDVEKVNHVKEVSRSTSNTYRKKKVNSDTSRDSQMTQQRREEKRREDIYITDILADLNKITTSSFRKTQKTKSLINARLREGFTVEDFAKVHSKKYA